MGPGRFLALEQAVKARGIELSGTGNQRYVQLAQAVGIGENDPLWRRLWDEPESGVMTWEEMEDAGNALLAAMEEAWKKENS